MIRQAISCDICGAEKKQTNHWYVTYDQGGELRVSGLDARNRLRPGAKHLCGQTCLHKLLDDFMARHSEVRPQPGIAVEAEPVAPPAATDASLTSNAAHRQAESSARPLTPPTAPMPASPKTLPFAAKPELVAMPGRLQAEDASPALDEPPRFASRNWRADAWDRERERAAERHPDRAARRRSG